MECVECLRQGLSRRLVFCFQLMTDQVRGQMFCLHVSIVYENLLINNLDSTFVLIG